MKINFDKYYIIRLIFYAIIGNVMYNAHIPITSWQFWAIIISVLAIDIISQYRGENKNE